MYDAIPDDDVGVFGALVARAEAHMLRLAVTYALLDASSTIELDQPGLGLRPRIATLDLG